MSAQAHWVAGRLTVHLPSADATTTTAAATASEAAKPKDPSPLTVAPKELFWSLGSFLVLLVLMRLVFYPRLRAGMEARSAHISDNVARGEAARSAAEAEVADYEAALADVRAEAQARVDGAAQRIEAERSVRMADVDAAQAARRAEALSEVEAAKVAASDRVAEATRQVVASAAARVLGAPAPEGAVRDAVERAMTAGAAR